MTFELRHVLDHRGRPVCLLLVACLLTPVGCGEVRVPDGGLSRSDAATGVDAALDGAWDAATSDVGPGDAGDAGALDMSTDDAGGGQWSLEVMIAGDGDGRVVSIPYGIDCPGTCRAEFSAGTSVLLEAEPIAPFRFGSWQGECQGSNVRCTLLLAATTTAAAIFDPPAGLWRFSRIEDLGAFDTRRAGTAQDINDRGDVVGSMEVASGADRPFRRISTATAPIELLGLGGSAGVAWGINSTGWAVGESRDPTEDYRAMLWEPAPSRMGRDLGTFGGPRSSAYGINSSNTIVGRAQDLGAAYRAFRLAPGGQLEDLGSLGGAESAAYDLNDAGQIVGSAETSMGATRAVRREATGAWVDLGTLGGRNSFGRRINGQGAVVGSSQTSGGTHAFYVGPPPATAMLDIGTLGGANSFAKGINDAGVVVGNSETASAVPRAFIWSTTGRQIVDLNVLLPREAPAWELRQASMINSAGTVVGMGVLDGQVRAFRMEQ